MHRYLNLFFITLVLLSLVLTSLVPPQTVSASPLQAPAFTITMTDALLNDGAGPISPDEDGDGKADPGETIEYTAVIQNSGADPATGVTFNDIIDLNTTLVAGSLNVSPLAADDTYATIGNTLLEVGVTPSGDPAVRVTGAAIDSLFDNDTEFLGDSFTLLSVEADTTAPFTTATEQGGSVTVEADGNFSYTPPVDFTGTDHFDYVITDDGAVGSSALTGAGRVTINVTQMVWYVKNNATAGGLGRSTDPFDTLAEAQTASAANETIYVFQGDGTTTGQNTGINLQSGQRLIGEGVALTIPVSINGGLNPTTLKAAGTRPLIGNSAGNGISVTTSSANFSGVEIRGLDISGTGAGSNAVDITTSSTFSGSFEIADNVISAAGAEGIDVNGGGSGTLTVNIHDNTVTATGNGIDIQRTAGTVNITAFDDNVVTGTTGGIGINIVGTGASILFDTTPGTASFDVVMGGATAIGSSGAGNGAGTSGMVLSNIRGDLSFSDLDVYADNGTALLVNGTSPNYTSTSGTRVTANTNTPTLVATGGAALDVTDANINIVPTIFRSSITTATRGVSLLRVSGTLTAPAGSTITSTNASGTGFFVDGGSNVNASVNVTYPGTITADIGRLVQIQNVTPTAAASYTFSGAITDNNDGDGGETGVSLAGNTNATITFSGGLVIRTTSNLAFSATGGGTINVCDESPCNPGATGFAVNTLTSTTGTTLNIVNTSIGANNLEFRSISSNGATNGIVLNTTGSSGGLKVKGNGSSCTSAGTCTGGSIQNTTGDGVLLTSTSGVSLTRLFVGSTGNHGINTSAVNGLTLTSSYVTNAGNGDNEYGLNLVNPSGTVTIDGTTFNNAADNLVYATHTGPLTLNVSNSSSFSYPSSVSGTANSAILIEPSGAGAATVSIQNSTFTNIVSASAQIGSNTAGATGTHNFMFSNNTINVTLPARGSGVVVSGQELTTTNITIDNNNFSGAGGNGVISLDTNDTSTIKGTANNNNIANPPGIGIFVAVDEAGKSDVTLNGNTITNSGGDGIQTVNFGGAGVSTMDMTITNNMVNGHSLNTAVNFVGGIAAFALSAPPEAGDSSCVVVRGNTVTATPASPTQCGGAPCVDYYIEETAGVLTFEEAPNTGNTTLNAAYVNSINDAGPVSVFGVIDLTNGATCNITGLGMLPDNDRVLAQNPADTNPVALAQAASTNLNSINTLAVASESVKLSEQVSEIDPANTAVNASANVGGEKPLFTVRPVPAQSGETVTVPAFTLPAGKSVTIKFQVTVNGPSLPLGTTQISNQGTVESNELADVLTDDPSSGGGSDPTITPVDRPDTTVTSINRAASSPTNAASVSWTVTFADAISGLTSSNFTLVNGGLGGTPAITAVTPVGAAPAIQWTVNASAGTGDGTLGLNLTNDTGLSHDTTNLTFTGQVYTIERTPPTTTSFTRQTPATSPTTADTLVFRVTFSEAMTNVDSADFTVTGTTATVTDVAFVSTGVYDVTVSGGDLAGYNGVVGLNFSGAMSMTDQAGNALPNTEPTTDQTYSLDNTAPTILSFTRFDPATSPTNADQLIFNVLFSEQVSGIGNSDFAVNGTTTASIVSVGIINTNGLYRVTINGGDLANFNGVVGLNFSNTAAMTDLAGNSFGVTEPTTDESYTVDNAGPTVTINQASGQADPTGASSINFTVVFSEAVTNFATSDVTVGGTANPTTGTVTETAPNDGTTYNVAVSGMSGNGTVTASIAAGVAQDAAANTNTASTSTDNSVTFDATQPTVTINQAGGQSDPTGTSPINFTVTFSEAVSGFATGDVDLSASTATGTLTGTVSGGPTTYNVAVSGMTGDGTVIANIPAGVATDGANLNTASTSTDNSVLYDALAPSVTINQAAGQNDPTNVSPINFTVTFSEAVTDFDDVSDVTLSGTAGATTFNITGGPTTYNVAVSGMTSDGTVNADVPAGASLDAASQPNGASTSTDNSVTFDATQPTVTINQAAGQSDPASGLINFTVVFSEPVTDFDDTADVTLSGTAGATTALITGGPTTYNVAVSGMTVDGTVTASILAGVATDGVNLNTASTSTDNTITFIADATPPTVSSVDRADSNPSSAASVNFTVTFSEAVTGVDLSDFTLTTTGVSGATVSNVSGSGDAYTVTVDTGTGNGTIRLDVLDDDTILDGVSHPLAGGFTSGQVYTVDKSVNVEVTIGGTSQGQFGVPAQTGFAGVNSGLVKIESTNTLPFLGAERVIYKVNNTNISFSEMMGLPDSQLDTTYWLPWYNSVDLDTQLRFGNASSTTATVHVYIGGVEMTGSPFNLLPGQGTRVRFAGINDGPVKIESNVNIVAAERVIYKVNGIPTSFSEMMALPNSQLDTTYWLPWYNNVDLDTQLRFANTTNSPATVHVYIGGQEMQGSPFTLAAGESTRKSFPGINDGLVQIVSDVPIVAAERVIYKVNGTPTSFSETMGLPDSQLETTYWLPRYNNVNLDTQLRFGNTSNLTATVHVYVGGVEMAGSPFTLLPGQSTRASFAGVNNGPVQVVSDVPIVAAERVIYKVNGTPTSFSEMIGLPDSLLDMIYWLPWYNNVDLDTQLRFELP